MTVLAPNSAPKWLKQTFDEADKNGDGSLSISEVLQLLHKLNVNLPRQRVKQMFRVSAERGSLCAPREHLQGATTGCRWVAGRGYPDLSCGRSPQGHGRLTGYHLLVTVLGSALLIVGKALDTVHRPYLRRMGT